MPAVEESPQMVAMGDARDASHGSKEDFSPVISELVGGQAQPATEPETIQALPPPPATLAGTSNATGKHYNVMVSNKAGYLCHVLVQTNWPVSPEVPFAIFTHPDNSALFRDVKHVGARKVMKTEPGYKEVQVEQLGDIQVLWIHRTYSTWLHVVEDSRDPECLRITFDLLRSDVLGKFSGRWELRPVREPTTDRVVGCRGKLIQDVLPKGMPSFMARLPILGGALRGISVRAVSRVLDDFAVAMEKVVAGHAAGRTTEAMLRELCGSVSEAAHANGAVNSFAFDAADEAEDEAEASEEIGAEGDGKEPVSAFDGASPASAPLLLKEKAEAMDGTPSALSVQAGGGASGGAPRAVVSAPRAAGGAAGEGGSEVTVMATAVAAASSS